LACRIVKFIASIIDSVESIRKVVYDRFIIIIKSFSDPSEVAVLSVEVIVLSDLEPKNVLQLEVIVCMVAPFKSCDT
jgi:hypothetical protein